MCPFCWLGDSLLDRALEEFPHKGSVQVRYHSYQLMPELPDDDPASITEILSDRKGLSAAQLNSMNAGIAERGASIGLDYRFDRALAVNTRRAHRLSHLAEREGRQREMIQRLFRAYFSEGLNVADLEVLAQLAADVGLDGDRVRAEVDAADLDAAVDADLRQAQQLGIQGVPFFVFDGKYAVSGAQPQEVFAQVLQKVWSEGADLPAASAV